MLNGGEGVLDLRNVTVPAGDTVDTDVEVRAGQAMVIVPEDANVEVTCSANAGEIDCLDSVQDGLNSETRVTQNGSSDQGTIESDRARRCRTCGGAKWLIRLPAGPGPSAGG